MFEFYLSKNYKLRCLSVSKRCLSINFRYCKNCKTSAWSLKGLNYKFRKPAVVTAFFLVDGLGSAIQKA